MLPFSLVNQHQYIYTKSSFIAGQLLHPVNGKGICAKGDQSFYHLGV
jgi:hypothetical protein